MATDSPEKGFKVVDRRGTEAEPPQEPSPDPHGPSPEIDFATFAMSLASSVLVHLGELPLPGGQKDERNLPLAKQTIDILGLLAEKTRGNLTADEAKLLEHLLYDLRLKYVEARR